MCFSRPQVSDFMTLSPQVQQLSNSSPNADALLAATLSFGKRLPPNNHNSTNRPSSPAGRENTGNYNPPLAAQQSPLKEQAHPRSPASTPKRPFHSRSSPNVAANLATTTPGSSLKRGDNKVDKAKEQEIMPVGGTVDVQRRLFYGGDTPQDDFPLPIISIRLPKVSPTRRNKSPEFQGVDATPLNDISSLKTLFEKSASGQPTARSTRYILPAMHAPKPIWPVASPSLAAAIIATQLPSSKSRQNLRQNSPILKPISATTHRSPIQSNFYSHPGSPSSLSELSLPLPYDGLRVSTSSPYRESTALNVSAISGHNNALLAATLTSKPKISPSSQTKIQPPKPPPPRKTQTGLQATTTTPSDRVLDPEDDSDYLSINSGTTGYSKYDTARSSMSPGFDQLSPSTASQSNICSSPAPPPPRRRRSIGQISRQSTGDRSSAALTAAVLSTASSRKASPSPAHSSHNLEQASLLPRHLTGDSVRAASLAPSRIASPALKTPPIPPAPRRGRRKSLPPPPKAGLRETMRKPLKTAAKDISPQRRKPHLVKHHPHKHSEGERRRWRHFVTESERRRYEGLWAANKGVLLADKNTGLAITTVPPSSRMKSHGPHNFQQQQHVWSSTPNYTELLADCIDSLIARDIWARSRLPFDHLADVWDLVDRGEKGRLSRDEFVVGTWLVDQSLKGRKLPSKVQDEVWQSVRRLGVQIQPVNKGEARGFS